MSANMLDKMMNEMLDCLRLALGLVEESNSGHCDEKFSELNRLAMLPLNRAV